MTRSGVRQAARFRDFGRLLALDLGCRRHPQHRDVLAQRGDSLRVFRHLEIAADDGEVGLAVAQCLRARRRALGLDRAQPHLAVRLVVEGLRQRLNHLDVVAVGRADRDAQGHRSHREIIARCQRADDSEYAGNQDECQPSLRRAGRWQWRGCHGIGLGHRSRKHPLDSSGRFVWLFVCQRAYDCILTVF